MPLSQDTYEVIQALLFLESEPVSEQALAHAVGEPQNLVTEALEEKAEELVSQKAGVLLEKTHAGWHFVTNPAYFETLSTYFENKTVKPLTESALEVLAIVAYTQPTTRETIRSIRGVNSDSLLMGLLAKGLVKEVDRADPPSNARLYGTTSQFLEHFGFTSLKDLPNLERFAANAEAASYIAQNLAEAEPQFATTSPELIASDDEPE